MQHRREVGANALETMIGHVALTREPCDDLRLLSFLDTFVLKRALELTRLLLHAAQLVFGPRQSGSGVRAAGSQATCLVMQVVDELGLSISSATRLVNVENSLPETRLDELEVHQCCLDAGGGRP